MKNMSKFLQVCVGISIVILSAGFLFQSVGTANAAPTPGKFLQQQTNNIGKYQMSTSSITVGEKFFQYILVWNTETGESKCYYFDRYDNKTYEWIAFGKDLPAKPL